MDPPDLARNVSLLGHTDQGGRGDGLLLVVNAVDLFAAEAFADESANPVSIATLPTPSKVDQYEPDSS